MTNKKRELMQKSIEELAKKGLLADEDMIQDPKEMKRQLDESFKKNISHMLFLNTLKKLGIIKNVRASMLMGKGV